jgi:hypothetical protein
MPLSIVRQLESGSSRVLLDEAADPDIVDQDFEPPQRSTTDPTAASPAAAWRRPSPAPTSPLPSPGDWRLIGPGRQ